MGSRDEFEVVRADFSKRTYRSKANFHYHVRVELMTPSRWMGAPGWRGWLEFHERLGVSDVTDDAGGVDIFLSETVCGILEMAHARVLKLNEECREQLKAAGYSDDEIEGIMED